MPLRSGLSHAASGFTSLVASAYLSAHSAVLMNATRAIGRTVLTVAPLGLSAYVTGLLVVAAAVSFVWGVAYHLRRHGGVELTDERDYM
ncbi:hypothetical protein EFA46_015135 (plasmid) [Halarchaeum sp. CBA1220]|uniref:hypothetical protein n=1 Tax=Halarchaeum sp. CBA1220 TaxID=1853682 RepID=UPI000F3A812A|nr:hypothetical protein [Halarchaeum sp. CBA1220]QLC35561.1 hypothetical protein EFA46_015135 [Halarchaeum sp. CBA1220]